jgi:diacylglycerol kinase family enzyme
VLSGKEARRTRVAAGLAIVLLAIVVVLSIASVNDDLRRLSVQIPLLLLAVAAGWYALTRTGVRRAAGVAVMVAALISVVVYGFVQDPSTFAVLLGRLALLVLAAVLGRWAVRRTWASAEPHGPPTAPVDEAVARGTGAARRPDGRPALIINLRSGGGKAERAHLVEECESRGIVPIILQQGDDLQELARRAIDGGAPAIGMAGGDGSQALVATVAAERQVPMVVVPAGTRNHLARDLGLDRDDVVGALAAFTEGVERRMDLGMVGDRVFVNNVSLGLYASIVSSPEYRDAKVDTALSTLPKLLGPGSQPFDLRFTGPDGRRRAQAHLVQISNNPYGGGSDIGRRPRLDTGHLAVITLQIDGDRSAAAFLAAVAGGRPERFSGFSSWTATTFEVDSSAEVAAGLDGESITLTPPLRFSVRPQALLLLLPPQAAAAPGASSAPRVTLKDVGRIAAGRPVVR